MKSQLCLGLKRPGKHRLPDISDRTLRLRRLWFHRHGIWNNLSRACEMNCHPKHYDTGLEEPCYTMDYMTGETTWHGPSLVGSIIDYIQKYGLIT